MHDDVAIIHQDPRPGRFSFPGAPLSKAARHSPSNGFGDGFDVTFRIAGANDQVVGNRGEIRGVKHHDVGGFFFKSDPANEQDFVFDV